MNPSIVEMLFFPNAQAVHPWNSSQQISLEVEFSPQGKIRHLHFLLPPSLDKKLCREILHFQTQAANLTLSEALELPWKEESYLPMPHWLLLSAYQNWTGDTPHWVDQKERLLCRCFGVSIERIKYFCGEKANPRLKDVADELNAGAGCSTCLPDLQGLLISLRTERPFQNPYPSLQRVPIGGRSPLRAMVEAHELTQNFLRDHPHIQGKIEFLEIKEYQLLFRWRGEEGPHRWMPLLEKKLAGHFQEELILVPVL